MWLRDGNEVRQRQGHRIPQTRLSTTAIRAPACGAGDAGEATLVVGWGVAVVARVDGRAAREQGHRRGRPAVVLQGAKPGVDGAGGGADLVAVGARDEAGRAA